MKRSMLVAVGVIGTALIVALLIVALWTHDAGDES
jgi:hypothetical protein